MILLTTEILLSQNQIPYGVISSGGGKVSGTTNIVTFSLGEPVIGKVAGSTNIAVIGFWDVYQQELLTTVEDEKPLPIEFKLEQNYPNPFNPSTRITYHLPKTANVELKVYDVLGNEIATLVDEVKPAGYYEVEFDASLISSGVYIYKIIAGDYSYSRKMILLK